MSRESDGSMVYAKRLNTAQRRALLDFAGLTGWEPIGQEDLDSGDTTFADLWATNVRLLESTLADVVNIDLRGTGA